MKKQIQDIIDQWQFDCAIDSDTFIFSDTRLDELLLPNRSLTRIVRETDFIKRLDFSKCPIIPQSLSNFPYVEEIILPDNIKVLPTIENCPRLVRIKCNTREITPNVHPCVIYSDRTTIKFSEELRKIPSNLFSYQEIDLSDCTKLTINEHDLQGCDVDTIILPSHINQLPSYALNRCKNLRNLYGGNIKSLAYGALTECPALERVQFSKELTKQEIFWLIKRLERDSLRDLGRCGYVLASDKNFSYIWSFNVRKFYYIKRIPQQEESFVTFNHPMREKIEIHNGMCKILRENEWFLESVENFHSDILWSPYRGFSEYRMEDNIHGYYANIQREAISTYLKLQNRLKQSIVDVIDEINNKVDSLDVKSIINSYHTSRTHEIHDKVGGDVREKFYIIRSSYYNDGYLETILPTYRDCSVSVGYGYTHNPNLYKDIEDDKKIDEHTRNNATNIYNKEEHKRFLINEYVQNIQKDAIFAERCLNIESARKMLNDEKKYLTGLHKVTALNKSIQI